MIYEALSFIVQELNDYFGLRSDIAEQKIVLSNLVNQDGTPALKEENKIVVSLVNIQEEKLGASSSSSIRNLKSMTGANPPLCLNLFVLFSAVFGSKLNEEALKYISALVGFFQANHVFDSQSYSDLDSSIDKLVFEIYNMDFLEQNQLFGSLGAKYAPSVLYKIRMLVIEEGMIRRDIGDVSKPIPNLGGGM
ncbi:MAG: hypothetical protein C0594_01780 [Marinilabiliales bacterium]|nr:MAG: hypothetical protein C0594_01780 [Marinilabiliales bacterium]